MTPACPECIDGKGLVTLFSSVRPCRTCAARRAEAAAVVPVTYTFNVTLGTVEADLAAAAAKVNAVAWTPAIHPVQLGPSMFAEVFDTIRLMRQVEDELLRSFALPKSVLEPPP